MRRTPQAVAVAAALQELGHGTNLQLMRAVRGQFPEITASTVHRITERLVENGVAIYGPSIDTSRVIDANTVPHDHFVCTSCQGLLDISLDEAAVQCIESQIPGQLLRTSIVISGICQACAPVTIGSSRDE